MGLEADIVFGSSERTLLLVSYSFGLLVRLLKQHSVQHSAESERDSSLCICFCSVVVFYADIVRGKSAESKRDCWIWFLFWLRVGPCSRHRVRQHVNPSVSVGSALLEFLVGLEADIVFSSVPNLNQTEGPIAIQAPV